MADEQEEITLESAGRKFRARPISFETVREDWNEYRLANGMLIRIKVVPSRIHLLLDDNGNPLTDATNAPLVGVVSSNVVVVETAPGKGVKS